LPGAPTIAQIDDYCYHLAPINEIKAEGIRGVLYLDSGVLLEMFDSQEPRSSVRRIIATVAAALAALGGLAWYFTQA
jgi:hypothetical protein